MANSDAESGLGEVETPASATDEPMIPSVTPLEDEPDPRRRSPVWLTALLILIVGAALWLLYRDFVSNQAPSTGLTPVAPVAGGMAVTSTPLTATTPVTTTAPAEPTELPGLQPGQTVAAGGAAGLRLYADAQLTAPVMDVYAAGALFTLLEPNDAYKEYPVVKDGHQWYRLRAADGLVGWAMDDTFTPVPDAPKPTSTSAG